MTVERREFEPFENTDAYPGMYTHRDEDEIYSSAHERLLAFLVGDPKISGKAYAWGKTANFINRPHLSQAYRETKGPFVAIDLCSALPITAQIYREDFNEDRFYSARRIVTDLIHRFQEIQASGPDKDFPAFGSLEPEEKEKIIAVLTSQESRIRRTITVATQKLLTRSRLDDEPKPDFKTEHTDRTLFLIEAFRFSSNVWAKLVPLSIFPPDLQEKFRKFTLESRLKEVLGEKDLKDVIIEIASHLAQASMRLRRPFAVLSLDIEDPAKILEEGENSFPAELKKTEFWEEAKYMRNFHVQGDISALPFKPESLSYISCMEGYPFYFSQFTLEEHIRFAQSVMDVLKPGGRAVFFPWHFIDHSKAQGDILRGVEAYLRDRKMEIVKIRYPHYVLEDMMGERETALTSHSPLFTQPHRQRLTSFIVIKPKTINSSQEGA